MGSYVPTSDRCLGQEGRRQGSLPLCVCPSSLTQAGVHLALATLKQLTMHVASQGRTLGSARLGCIDAELGVPSHAHAAHAAPAAARYRRSCPPASPPRRWRPCPLCAPPHPGRCTPGRDVGNVGGERMHGQCGWGTNGGGLHAQREGSWGSMVCLLQGREVAAEEVTFCGFGCVTRFV